MNLNTHTPVQPHIQLKPRKLDHLVRDVEEYGERLLQAYAGQDEHLATLDREGIPVPLKPFFDRIRSINERITTNHHVHVPIQTNEITSVIEMYYALGEMRSADVDAARQLSMGLLGLDNQSTDILHQFRRFAYGVHLTPLNEDDMATLKQVIQTARCKNVTDATTYPGGFNGLEPEARRAYMTLIDATATDQTRIQIDNNIRDVIRELLIDILVPCPIASIGIRNNITPLERDSVPNRVRVLIKRLHPDG